MKLCGFDVGLDKPLFLIAGPCVVESQQFRDTTLLHRFQGSPLLRVKLLKQSGKGIGLCHKIF